MVFCTLRSNREKQQAYEFVSIEDLVPQDYLLRKAEFAVQRDEAVRGFGRPQLYIHRPAGMQSPGSNPGQADYSLMSAYTASVSIGSAEEERQHLNQTTAPTPMAPTALLVQEDDAVKGLEAGKQQPSVPYLVRDEAGGDGPAVKIELSRPSFVIGRSTEVAQYIEPSEGVSRVHAEVSRTAGGYVLKDLDSRNGTFFRGEPMIPYKEYPLAEGDVFTIIKGDYTFRAV